MYSYAILQFFPFKMSSHWVFYAFCIQSYTILKISDFFSKNRFNYLIRHWIGSSPQKNSVLLHYSTILPLQNEFFLSILRHLYPKLCYFKNSGFFLQESLQLFNSSLNSKQSPEKFRTSTLFYNSSPLKWALTEHSTPFLSKVILFQRLEISSPKIASII